MTKTDNNKIYITYCNSKYNELRYENPVNNLENKTKITNPITIIHRKIVMLRDIKINGFKWNEKRWCQAVVNNQSVLKCYQLKKF